jgi:hypothetical protein
MWALIGLLLFMVTTTIFLTFQSNVYYTTREPFLNIAFNIILILLTSLFLLESLSFDVPCCISYWITHTGICTLSTIMIYRFASNTFRDAITEVLFHRTSSVMVQAQRLPSRANANGTQEANDTLSANSGAKGVLSPQKDVFYTNWFVRNRQYMYYSYRTNLLLWASSSYLFVGSMFTVFDPDVICDQQCPSNTRRKNRLLATLLFVLAHFGVFILIFIQNNRYAFLYWLSRPIFVWLIITASITFFYIFIGLFVFDLAFAYYQIPLLALAWITSNLYPLYSMWADSHTKKDVYLASLTDSLPPNMRDNLLENKQMFNLLVSWLGCGSVSDDALFWFQLQVLKGVVDQENQEAIYVRSQQVFDEFINPTTKVWNPTVVLPEAQAQLLANRLAEIKSYPAGWRAPYLFFELEQKLAKKLGMTITDTDTHVTRLLTPSEQKTARLPTVNV